MKIIKKKFLQKKAIYQVLLEGGEKLLLGLTDAGFDEGQELSEETLKELRTKSLYLSAKETALSYLGRRELFKKELIEKMLRKPFPRDIVLRIIKELEESNYLNDKKSARNLVENALLRGGIGKRRILALLTAKGYPKEEALELIEELIPKDYEEQELERFINKKKKAFLTQMERDIQKSLDKLKVKLRESENEARARQKLKADEQMVLAKVRAKHRERLFRKLVLAGFSPEASRKVATRIIPYENED